jgi:tRNA(adenine34) deaminase
MVNRVVGEGREYDQFYMHQALEQALKAFNSNEVPIGAIVVNPEGVVIGEGYNQTEQGFSQSRHAEVCALEQAGKVAKDWRLSGCTLYVTVEPCIMCMSLSCLSRIERVVYGAPSPLFGYQVGEYQLPEVYRKHLKGISSGVLSVEAQKLIEEFFQKKRVESEESRSNKSKAS